MNLTNVLSQGWVRSLKTYKKRNESNNKTFSLKRVFMKTQISWIHGHISFNTHNDTKQKPFGIFLVKITFKSFNPLIEKEILCMFPLLKVDNFKKFYNLVINKPISFLYVNINLY